MLDGFDSLRKGLVMYHELGLSTKEIYADLKAAGWDKSLTTLKRYQTEMRKEGLIAASPMARQQIAPKSERKPVENFEPEIEPVQVTVQPCYPTTVVMEAPVTVVEETPGLEGWTGKLNEHGSKIYRREMVSSRQRVEMANQLREVADAVEKTMKAASRDHKVKAGALLHLDVKTVEATLEREGRPGIKETLEALIEEAERIQTYAKATLRVFNYDDYKLS